tara:strand:+ start:565 stop:1044 length:480 start_codon:yes stop_codon:yes gene_type:complete
MGFEVAVAMMAVGTAVSAYGQYQAGKAQKRAYDYNAQIQEQNARIAQEQADYEARRQESRTRKMLAAQRVAYAGSGFTSNTGTALDTLRQTMSEGEMDKMAILYGGSVEAVNQRAQASLSRMQGKAAYKAGMYNAAGTLLAGGGQTYTTGAQGKALGLM